MGWWTGGPGQGVATGYGRPGRIMDSSTDLRCRVGDSGAGKRNLAFTKLPLLCKEGERFQPGTKISLSSHANRLLFKD